MATYLPRLTNYQTNNDDNRILDVFLSPRCSQVCCYIFDIQPGGLCLTKGYTPSVRFAAENSWQIERMEFERDGRLCFSAVPVSQCDARGAPAGVSLPGLRAGGEGGDGQQPNGHRVGRLRPAAYPRTRKSDNDDQSTAHRPTVAPPPPRLRRRRRRRRRHPFCRQNGV